MAERKAVVSWLAALIVAAPGTASAVGTITGTITDTGAAPLAGMEVRAWHAVPPGSGNFAIETMTLTDGAGAYSLVVPADDYKVDARMPPLYTGNYGDRWYDVASPGGTGYIAEEADLITVPDGATIPGIDIVLEVLGGFDGRTASGAGTGLAGVWVRSERNADPRINHTDQSKMTGMVGAFSFRGMVPAGDYQILTYDPAGVYDTGLFVGPYGISAGVVGAVGDLTLLPYAPDPYEPNGSPVCGAPAVDYSGFTVVPPLPWTSAPGTYIGPIGADVDWICVSAMLGDRFLATASTELTFGGALRYHPWTDPILSFWTGDGATMIVNDDDSGPGPLDAYVDTGPTPSAGCYCFVVSTFGDFGDGLWNGAGQASTGDFRLTVVMGNRPPALTVSEMGIAVPAPPGVLYIDEGATLTLDLTYADPEADPVLVGLDHRDSAGALVTGGTFSSGGGTGSYVWPVGGSAGLGSPYVITTTAEDAEFITTVTTIIVVNIVNLPPEVPTLIAPADGAVEATSTPTLTVGNSTDPDGDPLSYDIELYYADTATPVAQSFSLPEMGGGTTSTVTAPIPENTIVYWRARANDGLVGGTSPWTEFWTFVADTNNEPPTAPFLFKPFDGEVVLVRRPGMSATDTTDPEGNPISYFFEVAEDAAFTVLVAQSPPVPRDVLGSTTVWTVDVDLVWGATYYGRVWTEDPAGLSSAFSNVNAFSIKENIEPSQPEAETPEACVGTMYKTAPDAITVTNVVDPEGEPVTLELEVRPYDDDPDATAPLVTGSATQDEAADTTAIPFDASVLPAGHYRWRVRAFDGTAYSDWLTCDFWIAEGADLGDEPGGCGCGCRVVVAGAAQGGRATEACALLAAAAVALALFALRRRGRRAVR